MLHFPIQLTLHDILSREQQKQNEFIPGLLLFLGSAALSTFSIGSVNMVLGDPALVVLARDGGGIGGDRFGLKGLSGLLGGGLLGRLREKRLDPGLVDKVDCSSKGAREDEVEEDAWGNVNWVI